MTEPIDPGSTEFVLPIICPNCKKEIDLSMAFSLLPPKMEAVKEDESKEKQTEGAQEGDEEDEEQE
jgi:hypothetical protein